VVDPKGTVKIYLEILPDTHSGLVCGLARIPHFEIEDRQSPRHGGRFS